MSVLKSFIRRATPTQSVRYYPTIPIEDKSFPEVNPCSTKVAIANINLRFMLLYCQRQQEMDLNENLLKLHQRSLLQLL